MLRPHGDDDTLSMLRAAVRGVLERHWPAADALRLGGEPPAVRELWRLAAELGWTAFAPRGDGGGVAAALVVLEELGRAACPLPVLGSLLVMASLEGTPADLGQRVRQGLADGRDAVAVGLSMGDESDGRGGPSAGVTISTGAGDGRLSGRVRHVEGLPFCTRVMVVGRPGPLLAVIDAAAAGLRAVSTPGLAVPALSDVVLDGVSADAVWEVSVRRLDELCMLARLGCAARALGAAERAFELAADHARTREQFGSPIGRFQAVAHRLADCAMLRDAARLLIERTGQVADSGSSWQTAGSAATAFCGPALRRVARESQHVLAGVGYMEEHEAPRHFRRVHADTVSFGGATAARAELAAYLLDH